MGCDLHGSRNGRNFLTLVVDMKASECMLVKAHPDASQGGSDLVSCVHHSCV